MKTTRFALMLTVLLITMLMSVACFGFRSEPRGTTGSVALTTECKEGQLPSGKDNAGNLLCRDVPTAPTTQAFECHTDQFWTGKFNADGTPECYSLESAAPPRQLPPNNPPEDDNGSNRWIPGPGEMNDECSFSINPTEAVWVDAGCAISGDVFYSLQCQEPWIPLFDNRTKVGAVVDLKIRACIMAPTGASVIPDIQGAILMQQARGCGGNCDDVTVWVVDEAGSHQEGEAALPPAAEGRKPGYLASKGIAQPEVTPVVEPTEVAEPDASDSEEGSIVIKIPSREWIFLEAGMIIAGDVGLSHEEGGELTLKHDDKSETCAAVLLNQPAWVYIDGGWEAEASNRDIEDVKAGMGCNNVIEYSWP